MRTVIIVICLIMFQSLSFAGENNAGKQTVDSYVKGIERVCYNAGVRVKNRKRVLNAAVLVTREWLEDQDIKEEVIIKFTEMMREMCLDSYNAGLNIR